MYTYPYPNNPHYFSPIKTTASEHSMRDSLYEYLEMKIHSSFDFNKIKKVTVLGSFDRSCEISKFEKTGKLFNYMRPTIHINNTSAEIRCFPGIDYVFHYSNIISTYSNILNHPIHINCILPNEELCWNEICNSSLNSLPQVDTIIMGYVEGLDFISNDSKWSGSGTFLYKKITISSGDALLLGCKHTYWGEIAGRIVTFLAMLGVKKIIYAGKLGTLNPLYLPNNTIATGDCSLLPNGKLIKWNNLFSSKSNDIIKYGTHITIPSVLQETKNWVRNTKPLFSFVDPEIGHMAYAALNSNIQFSYLHIVSDNLSKKYSFDLSNERKEDVIISRKKLLEIISTNILEL